MATSSLIHLFLTAILLLPATTTFARFSPPDNILIACGATSAVVLPDHRRFLPVSTPAASRYVHLHHSSTPSLSLTDTPATPPPSPLHLTASLFPTPASYSFHVTSPGPHILRLHFYPFNSSHHNLAAAKFHVSASDFLLLSNFTTSSPTLKEFILPVNTETVIVSFIPADDSTFAFVNAIELISAPAELIGNVAISVMPNGTEKFHCLSMHAFETLYRVNVGGPKITPFNDSLWRTWVNDDRFISSDPTSYTVTHFGGPIQYPVNGKLITREVAPDSVYNTARSVKAGLKSNLTWEIGVSPGGIERYLVRMHFCDIASRTLNQLYFNVYINGLLAYEDFDASIVGELAYPFYLDFVVDVGDDSEMLTVVVGASKLSSTSQVHGLLNGLEIMRMNKTVGGMDGEFPIDWLARNAVTKGVWEFGRSVFCGLAFTSLLVMLFMLVTKLRAESRCAAALSRLPMGVGDNKMERGYQLVSSKLDF